MTESDNENLGEDVGVLAPRKSESLTSAGTIVSRFDRQAANTPGAMAVVCGEQSLTYRELNVRANRLAHYLRRFGVTTEKMVAIRLDRSIEALVAILGVLKAGGAYLPIDPAYPAERVAFMLEDAAVGVAVTQSDLPGFPEKFAGTIIDLTRDAAKIALEVETNPVLELEPSNAAYVIYTSGSTGRPKGVVVTHHNVIRLFEQTEQWYQFSGADVWTLFHSFAFDFSVWEIWGALFHGGRLVVVPYLVSRSPEAFYGLLAREGVTVLNQTPSAFRQLIWTEENAVQPKALKLRYVIFGGEALELQSLRPWFARHGDARPLLVNMYGITETTVHVTYRPIRLADIEAGLGSVIGEPIPDLAVHILNENFEACSTGVAGEICVGGEGVARGYLNRPELNRERFIPDPFSQTAGARLYRSGDLARRLRGGDLEYLGRIDHQVKIRGFRIELGEIEASLNSHPSVRESIVIACQQADGGSGLVAYLVCRDGGATIEDLRAFLSRKLPSYMVPAQFVFLESFPLTINGKVDRQRLPAPGAVRPVLQKEYVAPETDAEKILTEVWQETLHVSPIGVHDNFFELGGDSIRSIQTLAKARQKGLRLSLETLFAQPTIYQLARIAAGAESEEVSADDKPFAMVSEADRLKLPFEIADAYPMAKLQVGMVFHSDYDLQSAIFHDVFSFRLTIPFDEAKLRKAIDRLVERHAIFRTALDVFNYSEPLQLVYPEVKVPVGIEDLRSLPAAEQRKRLIEWVEVEKRNRFDWSVPPLMRLHVQRYSEATFQFIVSFHHAIMDGWSLAAMLTELFQDYAELLKGGQKSPASPAVTYRDFVRLEKKTMGSEGARNFWKKKLENPTVHSVPRWPATMRTGGREQVRGPEIFIPDDVLKGLKNVAHSLGVPIRTVLLAAHCRVMSVLSGESDIITGLVANGRPQVTDGERLIGLFLNTLPLRIRLEGGSWKELIRETFAAERELIPYRRVPLSEIQTLTGGKPLFETTFDFVQFHVYRDLPGYGNQSFLEDHYFEANNFNLFTTFMLDSDAAQLQMHFDYNPNELCRQQVEFMCDYYVNILAAMAAAPDSRYEELAPLADRERQRLLTEWNQTAREVPDVCIQDLFEKQAAKTPDAIAAVFEDQCLSYAQLNNRANYLAGHLTKMGVKPETLVGIHCERSLEMLIALLAVLKAGGAYVPLDPTFPAERIRYMIGDSGVRILLAQERLASTLRGADRQVLAVDTLFENYVEGPLDNRRSAADSNNLAYVIYTSGSTGNPKGVQIPHRAVVNFLGSMKTRPGLSSKDTLLAITTLSFDIAALELLLPLTVGAKVVIATRETAWDPTLLTKALEHHQVTTLQATPATWRAMIESGWVGSKNLKALCGGEALAPVLAARLIELCREVWNMYGPTETAIWSSVNKLEDVNGVVSIGRPIDNTEFYILDAQLHPVPIGAKGEIYIGGEGLARGYLNRPELTAEKFVAHPFKSGARLYRTGDLGSYLPDGALVCLGRSDSQVKIRGFRVELGEIDAALAIHPAVAASVTIARPDAAGGNRLLTYWIARPPGATSITELRNFLSDKLPGYMLPSAFVQLTEFPQTPNGKIDRARLPDPGHVRPELNRTFLAPRTPLEETLAEAWKGVLKLDRVGVQDNFFELGGHSIAAVQVIGRLRREFDTELTIASFFEHPTVEAFSIYLVNQMFDRSGMSVSEVDRIIAGSSPGGPATEGLEV